MNSKSKISGPGRVDSLAEASNVRSLSSIEPGKGGKVMHIDERLKLKVAAMGIRVGCHLIVDNRQPLKGPIVIKVGEMVTSIGWGMAEGIKVEVE